MKINLIWAMEQNEGIGIKGDLPWHISEDLQSFKKITLGQPIIMGLNTWISLPNKPLPKRRNIVLAPEIMPEVESYTSIDDCISTLENEGVTEVFVVGGAMVYGQFFPLASDLHITLVNKRTPGIDARFPVTIAEISKQFDKIEERQLTDIAVYTRWIRKSL